MTMFRLRVRSAVTVWIARCRGWVPLSPRVSSLMATGPGLDPDPGDRSPRLHGLYGAEYAPSSEIGMLRITHGRPLPSLLTTRSVWAAIMVFSDGEREWLALAARNKIEAVEEMERVVKRHPRHPSLIEKSIHLKSRLSFKDLMAMTAANHR